MDYSKKTGNIPEKLAHQLVEVYLDGFNDSRAFAEWFVAKSSLANTFFITKDNTITNAESFLDTKNFAQEFTDTIISAGYIVYKRATLFGKQMSLPYLSALSTKKEHRGQGKIGLLIKAAFDNMYLSGHAFTVLNPFNDTYYKRFGYADITFCKKSHIFGGKDYFIRKAVERDFWELIEVEIKHSKGINNHLIKDDVSLKELIDGFAVDGIDCNVVFEHKIAAAFYFASQNRIEYYAQISPQIIPQAELLKGLEYDDFPPYWQDNNFMQENSAYGEKHNDNLQTNNLWKQESCTSQIDDINQRQNQKNIEQVYIQARIINAQKALLEYPYSESIDGVYEFSIFDDFLRYNNQSITIEVKNKVAKLSNKPAQKRFSLDISELCTQMFLGGGIFDKWPTVFKDKY